METKRPRKRRHWGMTGGQVAVLGFSGILLFAILIVGALLLLEQPAVAPPVAQIQTAATQPVQASATPQNKPAYPPTWTPTVALTQPSCQSEAQIYLEQVKPLYLRVGDELKDTIGKPETETEQAIQKVQNTRQAIAAVPAPPCTEASRELSLRGLDRTIALVVTYSQGNVPSNLDEELSSSSDELAMGLTQLAALSEGRPTPAASASTIQSDTNSSTPLPKVQSTGKWLVAVDKSSFDDSPTVVLSLAAENSVDGWLDTYLPSLILRCKEKEVEAYVKVGMETDVEYDTEHSTVRLRFDKDSATTEKLGHSTDGKALFFQSPKSIINAMLAHDTLLFGFTPFNASPVETSFDLRGLKGVIGQLKQACQW